MSRVMGRACHTTSCQLASHFSSPSIGGAAVARSRPSCHLVTSEESSVSLLKQRLPRDYSGEMTFRFIVMDGCTVEFHLVADILTKLELFIALFLVH